MKKTILVFLLICSLFIIGAVVDTYELNWNIDVKGYVWQETIWHAYGGFQDSSVTVAITQDQWAQVTNADGDLFTGLEADGMTLSGGHAYYL